jgi:NADH-quinone oxidoreductase subunit J
VNVDLLAFVVVSIVLIGSALAVVLSKNLFHSVLWLALALTGTAGIFLMLDAEFLAAVQLLLYAGGVITIVVFAIVVTEHLVGERLSQTSRGIIPGLLVSASLATIVVTTIRKTELPYARPEIAADLTKALGVSVLTDHALAFELVGVLLVTALIGSIYFARPED